MNYSIMYVMTQTRKAFVNGVIHSKPSVIRQPVSGKVDEHLRPKLPRCVTVLLAPAVPCRRLSLVSERRNCGGAVQLSELEQKQEKKEKAPP